MNTMMRIVGMLVTFIGCLMMVMGSAVKDMMIFQAEMVMGFPMVFFGLKLLMS